MNQFKITNGPKAKIIQTEHTSVGVRTSVLQNRILQLVGTFRNEDGELIAFLWEDDKGGMWKTYKKENSETPSLTGVEAVPIKKVNGVWVTDLERSKRPIKIIKIEKVV